MVVGEEDYIKGLGLGQREDDAAPVGCWLYLSFFWYFFQTLFFSFLSICLRFPDFVICFWVEIWKGMLQQWLSDKKFNIFLFVGSVKEETIRANGDVCNSLKGWTNWKRKWKFSSKCSRNLNSKRKFSIFVVKKYFWSVNLICWEDPSSRQ